MRTFTPHFYHVIVVIREFGILATIKMNNLIRSLETFELRISEIKGVQESLHAI